MKLKLDKNLGRRGVDVLRESGHDVATAVDQDLCAADDRTLIGRCRDEQRALVTLDLDFGNPLLFKPADYSGIAVLRPSGPPSYRDLTAAVRTLADALESRDIRGRLWIVQPGRIREYSPEDDERT